MSNYYNWKEKINENELRKVIEILKNDGIIIFPTETVYGIGGNALSNAVIDRIYKVKRRPREKAVNIMVRNINEIKKYAEITSELEERIIKNCMPGPITLILKKKKNFGDYFTADNTTIGIRIPDNKIINTILNNIDFPIIAPSANISGRTSGIEVSDIMVDFENKVDAIIDGGKANLGLSSTIIQVIDGKINILRQGRITKEEILNKIQEI
ncbi:MAG: threonylcarbamoyl-AMP synthase [Clostridia bacterium]|nr:threonylcarbamoyl-AMP synthase [Clostridia bacterium]